ncbi:hypothetical protein GZH46_02106 [Fragariocoptes setiger]|uniref:Cyclase n=1 Tax=Fragariocoptes setiger TaxID=1670756 RepID=A0ABQ7S7I3_9ACAR|nr:hypothetical protein GZH46_02106 [Fragariocoptes setiger]
MLSSRYTIESMARITVLTFVIATVAHLAPFIATEALGPTITFGQSHKFEYIDLSHTLNNNTIHWLTHKDPVITFTKREKVPRNVTGTNSINATSPSYWLQADHLELDLHTGTHLDAPVHFSEGKWSVDQIPLERLMNIPLAVVSVKSQVDKSRSYEASMMDILEHEQKWNMKIPPNALVLFYTGISNSYASGRDAYYATTTNDARQGAIPGVHVDAAQFLVQNRSVVGVGIDSASIDNSIHVLGNPMTHETLCANNVYIIENVNTNLGRLTNYKPGYAYASILPIAIEKVSGVPIRLVATIDHYNSETASTHSTAHGSNIETMSHSKHYRSSGSTIGAILNSER